MCRLSSDMGMGPQPNFYFYFLPSSPFFHARLWENAEKGGKKGASVSNNIRRRRKCSRIWNFVVGVFVCVGRRSMQIYTKDGGGGESDFFLDCLPFCVVVEMAKNAFQDGGGMEVTPKKHPWVEKRKKRSPVWHQGVGRGKNGE